MAIFSEKIIGVKFIDAANTIIEILYKDNNQTISYALEVNWENQDFLDLLEEYSLEQIEIETFKKNKERANKEKNITSIVTKEVFIEKEISMFDFFDIFTLLEKRYDENLVFKMKTDIFKLRGFANLPKTKINKIKKSKDALELMYLVKLALNN